MRKIYNAFISLISQEIFLSGGHNIPLPDSTKEWEELHRLASSQHLWPVIYQCVADSQEYCQLPMDIQNKWMQEAMAFVANQVNQTEELKNVCRLLSENGIPYIILKGLSCRRYYPQPDTRPSSDEDVLINPDDYERCNELLNSSGYIGEDCFDSNSVQNEHEAHYRAKNGALNLEIHFNAVGMENDRQKRLSEVFKDVFLHTETVQYEGEQLMVLEPTYQLLHLLAHFYRHFFELGVGVRQMIDVLILLKFESGRIDWTQVEDLLEKGKMKNIFSAIVEAGIKYFNVEPKEIPENMWDRDVNPYDMIMDMLEGGIYGRTADTGRKFTEDFSLELDTGHNVWLNILFPSQQRLANRYPVLYHRKYLYAVYVVVRWFQLLKEYCANKKAVNDFKLKIKAGKERSNKLGQYIG